MQVASMRDLLQPEGQARKNTENWGCCDIAARGEESTRAVYLSPRSMSAAP